MDKLHSPISKLELRSNLGSLLKEAAAVILEGYRSGLDTANIFQHQVRNLDMLGVYCLLDEPGDCLNLSSFDFLDQKQSLISVPARVSKHDLTIFVDEADIFKQVVRSQEAIFVPNTRQQIQRIFAVQGNSAGKILSSKISRQPSIFVPLISKGSVKGTLTICAPFLTKSHIPDIISFADDISDLLISQNLTQDVRIRPGLQNGRSSVHLNLELLHDLDGNILSVNEAMALLLNISKEELIGKNLSEFLGGNTAEKSDFYLNAVRIEGKYSGILEIQSKSGTCIELITNSDLQGGLSDPEFVIVSAWEISDWDPDQNSFEQSSYPKETEETEQEFQRETWFVENFLAVIPSAVFTTDTEMRITSWNRVAEQITGYRTAEILGKPCAIISPECMTANCPLFDQTLETVVVSRECSLRHKSGVQIPVLKNCSQLKDASGEVIGGVESFTDLAEFKRSEAENKKINNRLNLAIQASGLGIYDHRIPMDETTFHSARWAEILGYEISDLPPGEMRTGWITSLIHPDDLPAIEAAYTNFISGQEKSYEVEIRMCHKSGEWIVVKCTAIANEWDEDGQVVHLVGALSDITDQKTSDLKTRRLLREQTAVNHLAIALGQSSNIADIYKTIFSHIRGLVDTEALIVSSFDPETQLIYPKYWIGTDGEADISDLPPIPLEKEGQGTQSQVIRSGDALLISNFRHAMENTVTEYIVSDEDGIVDEIPTEEKDKSTNSALLVPLKFKGITLGVLQVQSYRLNAYSQDDVKLLSSLANVVSISIQNYRLLEETKLHLTELRFINELSASMNEIDTIEEILPNFLDAVLGFLGSTAGGISLYDQDRDNFQDKLAVGWFKEASLAGLGSDLGIFKRVLEVKQSYLVKDFATDPYTKPGRRELFPENWGGACFPIMVQEKLIGIFYIAVESFRALKDKDINLLNTLVEIVGSVIQRITLLKKTRQQLQKMEALQAVDRMINSSLDLHLTMDIFLQQAVDHLGIDAAAILLLDPQDHRLKFSAGYGFWSDEIKKADLQLHDSQAGIAVLEQREVSILDLGQSDTSFAKETIHSLENFQSYMVAPLLSKGQASGVLEIFSRNKLIPNQEWLDFFRILVGQAAIAIDNANLFRDLQKSNYALELAYDKTIEGWAHALEYRDDETQGHSLRVTELTVKLARKMGIDDSELIHIRRGSLLHDIGKLAIPDEILHKPGKLTEEEWGLMRQHPDLAYQMINPIHYLRQALDIPKSHHEKWDGTGYPKGLQGLEIPLSARIFAVVDVYDALLSKRPYRDAWPKDQIITYIEDQSGVHFDPDIVEKFLTMLAELSSELRE